MPPLRHLYLLFVDFSEEVDEDDLDDDEFDEEVFVLLPDVLLLPCEAEVDLDEEDELLAGVLTDFD